MSESPVQSGQISGAPIWGQDSPAACSDPVLLEEGAGPDARWSADGGVTSSFRLTVASAVGVRHRLAGQVSEDAYAWRVTPSGGLVLAVADGVGSVAGSRWASKMACEVSKVLLAESDGPPDWDALDSTVREEVSAVGGATTLAAVWISSAGEAHYATLGDTVVRVLSGRDWDIPEAREDGLASNLTAAFPSATSSLSDNAGVIVLGQDSVLVLTTDGVADPVGDGPDTVAPALAALIEADPGPLGLLAGADFRRRGCADDRTIATVRLANP